MAWEKLEIKKNLWFIVMSSIKNETTDRPDIYL